MSEGLELEARDEYLDVRPVDGDPVGEWRDGRDGDWNNELELCLDIDGLGERSASQPSPEVHYSPCPAIPNRL